MKEIYYIVFSMLEGISMICFSFALFKIDIKYSVREVMLTTFVMSMGALLFSKHEILKALTPVLGIILLFSSFLFYFRLSFFSSLRLLTSGYFALGALQGVFVFLTNITSKSESLLQIQNDLTMGRMIQIVSSAILILASIHIRKRNGNFTTMNYDYNYKIKLTKLNTSILILVLIVVILLFTMYHFKNFLLEALFWVTCALGYYLVESRKESEEN
jgi:hypothetical protein